MAELGLIPRSDSKASAVSFSTLTQTWDYNIGSQRVLNDPGIGLRASKTRLKSLAETGLER